MTETGTRNPTVSIIIPVYNPGAYFAGSLASVRSQTYTDWELILVDDGSSDGSERACDEAAAQDARIRVLHQPNGGPSRARNAGLDAARGKYIAFVDADDEILPAYLEKLVDAAETYGSDLALCGFVRFRDEESAEAEYLPSSAPIGIYPDLPSFLQIYGETRTNMFGVSIWAKLYRTDIIRTHGLRFDPAISYEEDCIFNIGYFPHIHNVTAVGETLYRYRQMNESLSKSYRKDTFRFLVNGFRNRCALLKQFGRDDLVPKQEALLILVAKTAAVKIFRSGLRRKEKLAAYEEIVRDPELHRVATLAKRSGHRFTNLIVTALRRQNAKELSTVLRLWNAADRLKRAVGRLTGRAQVS